MRQLDWEPEVDASAVGVAAQHGTVTLSGFIDTYSGKLAAERAAKRVHGVRAVANDIEVRLRLDRTDPDIAQDATRALELRSMIPESYRPFQFVRVLTREKDNGRVRVNSFDRRATVCRRRSEEVDDRGLVLGHHGWRPGISTSVMAGGGRSTVVDNHSSERHGGAVSKS
jgi:hypothetical protein